MVKKIRQLRVYHLPIWLPFVMVASCLVYVPGTIDGTYGGRVLIIALIAVGLAVRRAKEEDEPHKGIIHLLVWLYVILTLFSIVVAGNKVESLASFGLPVIFLVIVHTLGGRLTLPRVIPLARAVVVIAGVVSILAIAENAGLISAWPSRSTSPHSTFLTKNLMSGWLFLSIPFLVLVVATEFKLWRAIGSVVLVSTASAIVIGQTRAVWVAVPVAIALVALSLLRSVVRTTPLKTLWHNQKWLLGSISIFLLVLIVVQPTRRTEDMSESATHKAATLLHPEQDSSAIERLAVWKHSFEMMKSHPILGVGSGNWKIEIPKYGLADYSYDSQNGKVLWTHPHNDWVAVASESGILSGVLYLAIFIVSIASAMRMSRRAQSVGASLFYASLAGILGGLIVYSSFDFPKDRPEHLLLIALLVASSIDTAGIGSRISEIFRKRRVRRLSRFLCVALSLLVVVVQSLRVVSEFHQWSVIRARYDQQWNDEIAESKAASMSGFVNLDVLSMPLSFYEAEGLYMQARYAEALQSSLRSLRVSPYHLPSLNDLGSCYENIGNHDTAEAYYQRALAISPNFQESLVNLAALYFNDGKYDRAKDLISRCDTTDPNSRAATYSRIIRSKSSPK